MCTRSRLSCVARTQRRQGCGNVSGRSLRFDACGVTNRHVGLVACISNNKVRFRCLNRRRARLAGDSIGDGAFTKGKRNGASLLFTLLGGGHCLAASVKYFAFDERDGIKLPAKMKIQSIAILGAGSWGTALAALWGKDDRALRLWARDKSVADKLQSTRENPGYLPGVAFPKSVKVTNQLGDCVDVDLIVFVTPSTALRTIAQSLRGIGVKKSAILLSCTKGIEHGTGMRMSEILCEQFPENPLAVLSGPNLAIEVARGLPTATVLACTDKRCATDLQSELGSARFRIYTGDELIGIELGGALKNIFAIAAGVSDGLGLGDNTKAALITRALAEMIRLGTAMGGRVATFYGLSGAGDLVATCYSRHSRNRRVGEQLGLGESLHKITSSMQMVAEGIPTTKSAYECAHRLNVETPIIDQVYAALYERRSLTQAMEELLGRDQKAERL
jgi:glycerol-3-phosphate dehydrogenase (NAD(P)+)